MQILDSSSRWMGGGFLKKNSRDSHESCFIIIIIFFYPIFNCFEREDCRSCRFCFSRRFFFFFFSISFLRVVSFVSFARDEVEAWSYGNVGQEVARWRRRQCMPLVPGGQRHHNGWKREHPPRRILEIPSITIYRPRCVPSSGLLYYSLRKMCRYNVSNSHGKHISPIL